MRGFKWIMSLHPFVFGFTIVFLTKNVEWRRYYRFGASGQGRLAVLGLVEHDTVDVFDPDRSMITFSHHP